MRGEIREIDEVIKELREEEKYRQELRRHFIKE